jgi:hypothetical protein
LREEAAHFSTSLLTNTVDFSSFIPIYTPPAKKELGIIADRAGGSDGTWYWHLAHKDEEKYEQLKVVA